MLKRYGTGVGACLAGVALLAGCGNGGVSGALSTEATAVEVAPSSAILEFSVPEAVIVCEPGVLETALTVNVVPKWPGPAPPEFMESNYPSGLCGTLTGPEVKDVYEAALKHPTALLDEGKLGRGESLSGAPVALWASEGEIVWLVIEPRW
ncbi:hypothetical protein [Rhodococcus sp. IEGM 1408]|uniref:hypothetical protein n=1 Tax=Rhodococcus sp. IEGM 1408 TaxID=3082220 RepID=UPI00295409C0|nr:hypothetical protein [Rhodococcus sp. IEGM 1408]MDV8003052.1 hypothetical protein [Rhodococcus sp. IEGM 1408]